MKRALPLLWLSGCLGTPPQPWQPSGEVCSEARRPLELDELTPWGTSPSAVRSRLGGSVDLTDSEGEPVSASLGFRGGPEWLIFATLEEQVEVEPPAFCEDGIELPARVRLGLGEVEVEVPGVLRAVGPMSQVLGGFVGRISTSELPSLDLEAPEAEVWGWWEAAHGGAEVRIEVRPVEPDAPSYEAGEAVIVLQSVGP